MTIGNMKKERINLVCEECSSAFQKLECHLKRGRGRFCSKRCFEVNRRNGSTVTCSNCSTQFYRRFGEQGQSLRQFCSRVCAFSYRRVNAKPTTYLKTDGVHSHIVIAEASLGRKLTKSEIVHHIDENKHNNAIENLAVLPSQQFHAQVHFGKVAFDQYRLINLSAAHGGKQ